MTQNASPLSIKFKIPTVCLCKSSHLIRYYKTSIVEAEVQVWHNQTGDSQNSIPACLTTLFRVDQYSDIIRPALIGRPQGVLLSQAETFWTTNHQKLV